MSKFWSASNGYQGYGPVCALVQADTREQAIAAAEKAFASELAENPRQNSAENAEWCAVQSIVEFTFPYIGDVLP
ncbi:MAG: hypothetical protein IIZ13_08175 [Renibacterium sp.]|nr:hypothetical protein [Renibacterium sp.]